MEVSIPQPLCFGLRFGMLSRSFQDAVPRLVFLLTFQKVQLKGDWKPGTKRLCRGGPFEIAFNEAL